MVSEVTVTRLLLSMLPSWSRWKRMIYPNNERDPAEQWVNKGGLEGGHCASAKIALQFILGSLILMIALLYTNGYAQVDSATTSTQWLSYLPSGEGKELLKVLCSSCHDLSRIVTLRSDRETWWQSVNGMLAGWDPQYAEYLEDDVEILSRYLAQYFGPLTPTYETLQGNPELREAYLRGEIKSLISINTASLSELTRLPGISKDTAERIIAYRASHGSFKSSGDLKTLAGIGEKEFEKLKVLITVD